jgi:hypothetical protein
VRADIVTGMKVALEYVADIESRALSLDDYIEGEIQEE